MTRFQAKWHRAGGDASPTDAIIDSQSVKRRKRGASIDPHGFDAGKKIKAKRRHLFVDTQDLLLLALVHSARVQDRDGGVALLATLLGRFPFLRSCSPIALLGADFADTLGKIMPRLEIEVVKRSEQVKGFRRDLCSIEFGAISSMTRCGEVDRLIGWPLVEARRPSALRIVIWPAPAKTRTTWP